MYSIRAIFNNIRKYHKSVIPIQKSVLSKTQYLYQPNRFLSEVEDESDKIIQELCNHDPELEKKLRILMLEVEVMRQDGRYAPNILNTNQWQRLMILPSRNQRNNYLTYLWKTEKAKENQKAKKEARKKEYEESKPEENKEFPDDLQYGLTNKALFLRIRDQSINTFDNYRALQAIQYGQPVIIDCSYEEHMVLRETINAAKQMTFAFGDNRIHKDPFDIHMCNVNLQGDFMVQLRRNIPSVEEPWFPMHIHTKTYLDVFPKEKLVYLTPHCREELTHYDPDAIYIIGCMVDKMNNEPLSLAKAKKDGIKMAKLPLDRFLEWAPGSKKNLNINHMVPILSDLKLTGDWEFALRHIPRRKLMQTKILAMQKRIKNNPLLKEDVFRNLNMHPKYKGFALKKKIKPKKSLFDDDSI